MLNPKSMGKLGVKGSEYLKLRPNLAAIFKFNWNYAEALEAQEVLVSRIQDYPHEKYLIFCNHPHCFTVGTGIQKKTREAFPELKDFDESVDLDFPLYHIKRGGGLTYHYPGQLVIYPIVKLDQSQWTLGTLIHSLADALIEELSDVGARGLEYKRDLLGIWSPQGKISSFGFGVERFVTHHGMASNFDYDEKMFKALAKINPCGLSPDSYSTIEDILGKGVTDWYDLSRKILDRFLKKIFFVRKSNSL